jgi:hypothetical protein
VKSAIQEGFLDIRANAQQIKLMIADHYPTLLVGTANSLITKYTFQSMSDQGEQSRALVNRLQANATTQGEGESGEVSLPMRVKPVELTLETLGCPFFKFTQAYFIDFQTDSSIDDVYYVVRIKHSLSPGSFKTSLSLRSQEEFHTFVDHSEDVAKTIAVLVKESGLMKK